jgi:UDP-glucose 4-epimerase
MTHALITGGAGFIGSHLAEHLLRAGQRVTVIDNLSTGRLSNIAHLQADANFRAVIDDIRNAMVLDRLASECDVIYHLAAMVGVQRIINQPIDTIEVNIGGTEAVLKAARRYRRKTLIASTSEVYGKGVRFPFTEDDDTLMGPTSRNRWAYATSKAVDEFLALAYHREADLPVVLFRLFNTVGPRQQGQYGMVVPRFIKWALRGEPLQVYGDGQQQRCFGNVFRAVDAIVRLSNTPSAVGQVFNIGSDEEVSVLQLAERVIARTDSRSAIQLVPYNEAYNDGFEDFRRRIPSTDKLHHYTAWTHDTTLNETLDQMIAYYHAHSAEWQQG